ncbi:MAG: flagellar motor switch protein FliM [Bacillota bacterium]|nr:flagellar motor switch protein FliM [Bacillota bacterium]
MKTRPGGAVRPYNFRAPDKFSKDQLRTILMLHEGFARGATTMFSAHLRSWVEVRTVTAMQMSYRQFSQELGEKSILAVTSVLPLPQRMGWSLDPRLALYMLDRLLGGPGTVPAEGRTLSDIEEVVVRRILQNMMASWRDAWKPVVVTTPRVEALETNPLFAQLAAPDDIVLVVEHQVQVDGFTGALKSCFPFRVLEPILPRLAARGGFWAEPENHQANTAERMARHLFQVEVPLTVEVGHVAMTVEKLLSLKKGDLLTLPQGPGAELSLCVGGEPTFSVTVGQASRRLAVLVRHPLKGGEGGGR